MAIGNLQGRARTSTRSPEAKGCCDRCGFWYPLSGLQRQFQWAGANLFDTGYLVCKRDLDTPFEQYKVLILPPDPIPRTNPRPDQMVTAPAILGVPPPTTPGNLGFSVYLLGASTPGQYPTDKATVLSDVAAQSGIATPGGIIDRSRTILPVNTALQVMIANSGRSYLLLYNPSVPQVQIALAATTATAWGVITNVIIGPGQAFLMATALGLGACYAGIVSAVGQNVLPLWAWEA